MCTNIAPEVFELGDEGVARVLNGGDVPVGLRNRVADAIACCPTEAIALRHDELSAETDDP